MDETAFALSEKQAAAKARALRVRLCGLTEREAGKTFGTYAPTHETQARAAELLKAQVEVPQGNLYLWGEPGVGKTHLALAYLNAAIDRHPVRFETASELLMRVRATMEQTSDLEHIQRLARPGISRFVLDDFGVQKQSEWSLQFFDTLFDHWYRQGTKGWVITSNLSLNDVSGQISDRIASRIAEQAVVLRLAGDDQRLNARGGANRFVTKPQGGSR